MIGKTILHYKVLEKLGEGGMGVVYKAHDTKLERSVAIKFLPRPIAASAEERERFKIEAKAAAALNHPNIAHIYAIEETSEEMFIVMEYIEGGELREIVGAHCNVSLRLDEILDYAQQIASGLQAAHEQGVVHRDIKSANIMITDKGQVKIMDFGLAKVAGGAQLTKDQSTLGTAAYMSPEQARGEDADHRCDIWAFGVVLYEMLCGHTPFEGDYEQVVIYSIMNEEPQPISHLREDVPPGLERIIGECLNKAPDKRIQSATALLTALHDLPKGEESGSNERSYDGASARQTGVPWPRILAATSLVLSAILLVMLFSRDRDKMIRSNVRLAVVDFVNETDEAELDGLSGMLITSLQQSRHLTVLTRSRMFDVLKQMEQVDVSRIDEVLGREVCRRANVNAMAIAHIRKFGNLYSIDLKVTNPQTDEYLITTRVEGSQKESVLSMIDELSQRTREALQEKESEIVATSREVVGLTTTNLEAYQHYFQGRQFTDQLRFKEALEHFRQAIALDSTFALAYKGLAYALDWDTNQQQARTYIDKAMLLLDRIPEREKFIVRAVNARLTQGYGESIPILHDMEARFPDDKEMMFLLGDFSYHLNEILTARDYLERVVKIDPLHERAINHLARVYRDLGDEANWLKYAGFYSEILKKMESLYPDDIEIMHNVGDWAYHTMDYDLAREYLERVLAVEPSFTRSIDHLVRTYRDLEDYERMLLLARRYETVTDGAPRAFVYLGNAHEKLGDYRQARLYYKKALELTPNDLDAQRQLGYVEFRLGNYAEAEKGLRATLAADSSFATYNVLAKVWVGAGLDLMEGRELAALALETKPSPYHELATIYLYYAVPEHTLGLAHLKLKEYEKAVDYLQRAVSAYPDRQEIQADLIEAKNQFRNAQK